MKKIVVLISGSGTNLQAIMDACQAGKINAEICAVYSNKSDALGLSRAQEAGIPTFVIQPENYINREDYDHALQQAIDSHDTDLLVLAGYMRILTADFVRHYRGKIINIHPSLLPKYPGLHTHRKAMENGDQEHGTSVHFVTEQLDGGPVILQAKVPIFADDHENDVVERIKTQEHDIYPVVIDWFISSRLQMVGNNAQLDGKVLPEHGYASDD